MIDADGSHFGKLAVGMGFLTRDDLQKVISVQEELRALGVEKRLGEICLEKSILNEEQVLLILRGQGKHILACHACRKTYDMHPWKPGQTSFCKRCGGKLTEPLRRSPPPQTPTIHSHPDLPEEIVHLLPGYTIAGQIGQGGMGMVYKTYDTILDRWVAVKLLAPFLADNAGYVQRFFMEAKNLQKLHHPNIVEAYDAGVAGEHKFFIMEFVDGMNLFDVLEKRARLPEKKALEIVRQVALGLAYAWEHRIIHRDVKPQNIMLTHNRRVKLCDLGLSKDVSIDMELTMTGSINCSPAYASPEQCEGSKHLTCKTDIYSLGVVLYEMAVGELPFQGDAPGQFLIQHVTKSVPHPLTRNPSLSPRTARLILKMLEKAPANRPEPAEIARVARKLLNAKAVK